MNIVSTLDVRISIDLVYVNMKIDDFFITYILKKIIDDIKNGKKHFRHVYVVKKDT